MSRDVLGTEYTFVDLTFEDGRTATVVTTQSAEALGVVVLGLRHVDKVRVERMTAGEKFDRLLPVGPMISWRED
jgi:hypothetical protein